MLKLLLEIWSIDALTTFDYELDSDQFKDKVRFRQYKLVVFTGEKVYNQFKKMIQCNEYTVPENILLFKSAPQIEIFKKAAWLKQFFNFILILFLFIFKLKI